MLGVVAWAYLSSYTAVQNRQGKKCKTLKITTVKRAGGVAEVIESKRAQVYMPVPTTKK
jgi:hypothetical protein